MRIETVAKALMGDIQLHLSAAPFFQREDLLHLPALSGVATITRYRYVCLAVHHLIQQRKLVMKGRSDLCLASRARDYEIETKDFGARYERTILRIVHQQHRPFLVMDVVEAWRSDQHLTENSKRVAVRGALRRLVRAGTLVQDDFRFQAKPNRARASKEKKAA